MVSTTTTLTDRIIADAKSLPDLIARASVADPALAQKWTGTALIASKTVWGNAATLVISYVVTKYGLDYDDQTVALVSGVLVMISTAALRYVTERPVTGILTAATPAEAIAAMTPTTGVNP